MATTGSTVGINTAKISSMKKALNDYIAAVNKNVEIAASRANIQKAIKGSSTENSLMELNKKIDAEFAEVTSKLNQFSSILDEMKTEYSKNDTSNTTFAEVANKVNK